MTPEQLGQLQQQLYALQAENEQLRQQLAHLAQRQQNQAERRSQVVRGSGRLLIPLLDRHKVVRSFGKLAETTGRFSGPREQWPTRDDIQGDAQRFLEALVRFAVRRRTLLLLLALIGAVIPGIQIWLVVQQNDIIANQNEIVDEQKELSRVQVFDIVSRSMTEGDRNAKLMTGALLSTADPEFLADVIEEAFDPALDYGGADSYNATSRRLADAAFRGHLIRAAVRGINRRAQPQGEQPADLKALADQSLPSLHQIVVDAQTRVPGVMRLGKGRSGSDDAKLGALDEEAEAYVVRVGKAIQMYARLARISGRDAELYEDLRPLLHRIKWNELADNRFRLALTLGLELLLLDVAVEPSPADSLEPDPGGAGLSREEARAKGLSALREAMGEDLVDWAALGRATEGA